MDTAKISLWALFGSEAITALYGLRWMIVLAVVLIAADFWFGLSETLKSGGDFRLSRAGRRTLNKLVDYLTYLLVGCLFGLAIFEPLGLTSHIVTSAVGLGLGCVFELDSIIGHICALHGIRTKFSLKALVVVLLRRKYKPIDEAIEVFNRDEDTNRQRPRE